MSMDLEKKTFSTQPDYLIAGTAEIVTAAKEAAAALKRGAPVVLDGSGKLAAVTVSGGPGTYKTEATGLYLSGEFFANALVLPANGSAADLEVPFRALGIFLK